jgi:hypothetical protein
MCSLSEEGTGGGVSERYPGVGHAGDGCQVPTQEQHAEAHVMGSQGRRLAAMMEPIAVTAAVIAFASRTQPRLAAL